ncbi:MAG: VOC family protein [Anaerolineae bacterium]|nr:VOC family protein [Anaerolineae bacterium]
MTRPTIDQQITFLYTRDLSKTADFYERVMLMPLVLDQGTCRIYHVAGDAYLGFCERDETADKPTGILCTLVTDEVDAWYTYLRSEGIPIERMPTVNKVYGIYHFFALDPNGYVIEVQQFLDPAWHNLEATTDF